MFLVSKRYTSVMRNINRNVERMFLASTHPVGPQKLELVADRTNAKQQPCISHLVMASWMMSPRLWHSWVPTDNAALQLELSELATSCVSLFMEKHSLSAFSD